MTKRYPFKFLDAYNKADTDIFFGRDEEVEALYEMTFQSDILLVYGASGTGKTSLINCGLAGRFQAHDWLALNIRRGNDLNASLQHKLEEATAGVGVADTDLDLSWLDEDEAVDETESPLSRQLTAIYRQYFRPVYLIFDQFEELYVLGSKAEQAQFIRNIQEIQSVDQPVKMIFVIREEYLGHLFEFERAVPQLLRKKLRVEPMNLDKVGQVVRGAAALDRSNVRLEAGQEAAIVEGIFGKIRGSEQTLAIQLPYLQVFLDKLYLQVTGDEARQAEAVFTTQALAEMGDIGDVLRDFLEEQAVRIQKQLSDQYPKLPEDAVWQILSPLATLEGTKEPMLEEMLLQRLAHLPAKAVRNGLQMLDQSRILRYDENEGRYEVAHDSLAARIAEHRNDDEIALLEIRRLISSQMALKAEARALFTEKQLNLIDPYLDKLGLEPEAVKLIEDSRKEVAATARRRRRRNLIIGSILAAAAIVAIFFAFQANAKTIEAERALLQAKKAEATAVEANKATEQALAEAEAQKNIAITEKERSDAISEEAQKTLNSLRTSNEKYVDQLISEARDLINERKYQEALSVLNTGKAVLADHPPLGKAFDDLADQIIQISEALIGRLQYELALDTLYFARTFRKEYSPLKRAFQQMVDQGMKDLEGTSNEVIEKGASIIIALKQIKDNYPPLGKASRELVRKLILKLDYENALDLFNLENLAKEDRSNAASLIYELIYFFYESSQYDKALEALDKADDLFTVTDLKRQLEVNPEKPDQIRQALSELDKGLFEKMEARYYPVMVTVPGGMFTMGCDPAIDTLCQNDETQHQVSVDSFRIAKHETTWWQYGLFCQATEREYRSPDWGTDGDNPVVYVIWYDAIEYANWVSKQLGRNSVYSGDLDSKTVQADWAKNGYRLPTEAEWEYAAKGGKSKQEFIYSGSDSLNLVGWYRRNSNTDGIDRTRAVAQKAANSLGLYDMSGNVWEWCWDWYESDYDSEASDNPKGPDEGSRRVIRGGSWDGGANRSGVSYRSEDYPDARDTYMGFRLVRSLQFNGQ